MSKSSLIIIRTILAKLSSGEFYSGQALANDLGLSRTSVANYIKQLKELGLDIYSVKGRGYSLSSAITLLDPVQINAPKRVKRPAILVHEITDSTNIQLQQRIKSGTITELGSAIVAEAQTAGRGRRGRNWYSPFGSNLYFSMYWRLDHGMQGAMGLSLAVGLAIVRTLKHYYSVIAKLKWPNDVYINDKKVAGILIELSGQANADCDVVIGLGLNINMPANASSNIDQPFTSLAQHTVLPIDRNKLIVYLQQELIHILTEFSQSGFAGFVNEFNDVNQYQNRLIKIITAEEQLGICRGVDDQGALLLETKQGLQTIFGGEVSVRGQN
ncbi:bifunctional biotin--[acetyl-CoA-carboxylase] ligase/biotin operon repressor BirA [Rheinheimera sp. MMS21-TC3]|uniref:bifunctional biotin--[acetyl-CoA-carboxylase] ligase/biotin operon repressor BirA n=1 Tax=Rheinheimera sp. MMS21-TC3 TaxID=3072790 RepID=UPI0028C4894D|nr:bifunctional biotin--[acetyl-CoA-carboxylase] ligase/biotin operon repressor BirA [Rheinheimera sp. MMS21-TC3]WNO59862.1 bifunctional biotin--[acetyl-CoA-carboxylase] ligase/biotin operon repressor BirA [Rheinheimera sp. MMS21-TC3]